MPEGDEAQVEDVVGTDATHLHLHAAACIDVTARLRASVLVRQEDARPQPRRDVDAGRGMQVQVGRVRPDNIFHLRFVALGHNTVRGAAGGSVLNAELMAVRGLLPAP